MLTRVDAQSGLDSLPRTKCKHCIDGYRVDPRLAGAWLKIVRHAAGLSHLALARTSGRPKGFYVDIERGRSKLTQEVVDWYFDRCCTQGDSDGG